MSHRQHVKRFLGENFVGNKLQPLCHSTALTSSFADDDDASSRSDGTTSFDADFAEAMCKPLPKWYQDAEEEREEVLKELEMNRERILQEFKSKYEVSEDQKLAESKYLSERYKKRIQKGKEIERTKNKQKGLFGLFGRTGASEENRNLVNEDMETVSDVDLSTKEKWDAFWKEEKEQTGFSLPGFFEVFPELKLRWPTWARRKDGSAIECERDQDCPFPLACCPHPIIPGQKFCCSGWGQRVLVKAYQPQEIVSDAMANRNRGRRENDIPERENWRPDPNV